jgi:hypothetical protein
MRGRKAQGSPGGWPGLFIRSGQYSTRMIPVASRSHPSTLDEDEVRLRATGARFDGGAGTPILDTLAIKILSFNWAPFKGVCEMGIIEHPWF